MATKILMADDSTTIQKVIKIALSNVLVDIDEAKNIAELNFHLSKSDYDLLLVDSNLAGIDHISQLADYIKKFKTIPVIILKGTFDPQLTLDFKKFEFEYILKKPFSTEELKKTIENTGVELQLKSSQLKPEENTHIETAKSQQDYLKNKKFVKNQVLSSITSNDNKDFKNIFSDSMFDKQGNIRKELKDVIENIVNTEANRLINLYCEKNAKQIIESFLRNELEKITNQKIDISDL